MLWITGGSNQPVYPDEKNTDVVRAARFAVERGMVAASLSHVPNQPIIFKDDPLQESRTEDAVIAYTWYKF